MRQKVREKKKIEVEAYLKFLLQIQQKKLNTANCTALPCEKSELQLKA